jgi:hypothetical protein
MKSLSLFLLVATLLASHYGMTGTVGAIWEGSDH